MSLKLYTRAGIWTQSFQPLKTSQSSISSLSKKSASRMKSVCVELSLRYEDPSHPIYVEAYACYPLVKEEKVLVKELEEFLLDKVVEMFGLHSLTIIDNEGMYYTDYESMEWVITWSHGKGDEREAVGIVQIE